MTKITRESIDGWVGPMRSKKTLMMLSEVDAAEACGRNVMVFKPDNDIRFAIDEVRSRAGGCHKAIAIPIDHPEKILDYIAASQERVDLAAVDEAQFMDPILKEVFLELAEDKKEPKKIVYCGLDQDFRGDAFPTMEKIMPISTIHTVEAKCMFPLNGNGRLCGADAHHTQRLLNGEPDSYTSPTVIIEQPGLAVTYEARCTEHWRVKKMPPRRISRG